MRFAAWGISKTIVEGGLLVGIPICPFGRVAVNSLLFPGRCVPATFGRSENQAHGKPSIWYADQRSGSLHECRRTRAECGTSGELFPSPACVEDRSRHR